MCDSVVAAGPHTSSGEMLFAKNSDRRFDECQPFVQVPGALHPRGSMVACTHLSIPQVAETYRVMGHSPWWIWGFEHGVNEYGVAIGNHTVFSKEPVEEDAGLVGMDLVRLGLERGRNAREALEMIAALLETYGQGGIAMAPGSGGAGYHNSFLLADPDQAWVLETSGRRWAARAVELEALSNQLTLGSDWQIGSRDLSSFARSEGWWRQTGRLDVAEAYRPTVIPPQISSGRLRRSRELLKQGQGQHDAYKMMSLLRDHATNDGRPGDEMTPADEAFFTLCMHSEPIGTTTASIVAPLPTDRTAPWPVWVSFGSPCTSIFLPVYIEGNVPPELAAGGSAADGASNSEAGQPNRDSAWWVFRELQERCRRRLCAPRASRSRLLAPNRRVG